MQISKREINQLRKLTDLCQIIIDKAESADTPPTGKTRPVTKVKRVRRSGKELIAFRRMLKAERKRGVSAPELAKKHRVSTTYIYTL